MLEKPKYGWSKFSLNETKSYYLSYLDDIAIKWLDNAINGLEELIPFCVKGNLEPTRILCVVSYYHCYIILEDVEDYQLGEEYILPEYSHTKMIEFCECLYKDISSELDEWVKFYNPGGDYNEKDFKEKKKLLVQKLKKLRELIEKRRVNFSKGHCFM